MEKIYLSGYLHYLEGSNLEFYKKIIHNFSDKNIELRNDMEILYTTKEDLDLDHNIKCLYYNLYRIKRVDAVAILPTWNENIISRFEIAYAIACKIPIIDAETLKPIQLNLEFKITENGSND